MKVIAKQTAKNSYDQVLFVQGKAYAVVGIFKNGVYVINELHTESPVRNRDIGKQFEVAE